MTIDKFSSNSSSFHEIPQASGGHSKEEEDFAKAVLVHLVSKYPEFEDELRQMYWSRVRAAENRGLPIDVVEIQKDISREMGQIAPDLLAAREERLALIRNPETRASAPKLRQFERDYA
ncbi:MAG: hypothetical protein LBI69_00725, partial [Puniceicoccales bacterium]|nr:hypothetical protein [Puniceicoccales bacterium]